MSTEAPERPICSCGQPMVMIRSTGFFLCAHCDQICLKNDRQCVNHRLLSLGTARKWESTAPTGEMRKDR